MPGMWRLERLAASHAVHLLLVVAVAACFDTLSLRHNINWLDEGWPL
jgi:hypothetical protein